MVPKAVAMDPAAGPIVKDAQYFGFWATALSLGLLCGGTVVYLLWEILLLLRRKL